MDIERFKSEVTDFVDVYCYEYMTEVSIVFDTEDHDNPTATLNMADIRGTDWEVPLAVNDCDDELAIDVGDAGFINADAGGLYAYLWHEAKDRISR